MRLDLGFGLGRAAQSLAAAAYVTIEQLLAGQVTWTAGAGVTLEASGGLVKTAQQYALSSATQRVLNTWVLGGERA